MSDQQDKATGDLFIPAHTLPLSDYISPEAKAAVIGSQQWEAEFARFYAANADNRPAIRDKYDSMMEKLVADHRANHAVSIESTTIAGVYAESFLPESGVAPENDSKILINLHGGGFEVGARTGGQAESIPICDLTKTQVISIDYRQGPEHVFPAASEDVLAVYKTLLKDYAPQNIGIYGSSAGGILTAQSTARFIHEGLPLPGAIGMFGCAGVINYQSDSRRRQFVLTGVKNPRLQDHIYLKGDPQDPLFFPAYFPEVMAQFPPSLLITSTRDQALSSVTYTHTKLVEQGVNAQLHVWPDLGHCFYVNPNMPEAQQVYRVIAHFFNKHMGKTDV